jgi:O-antigen/teichoic acid export membrane protein
MLATTAIVVYQQIDVLVISWTASERDLGWYSAAEVLVGTLLAPATVLFSAIFPSLGRLHELDSAALQGLVQRTFSLLILVSVPVGVGTMLVATSFVPTLYGQDFSGSGEALVAFGPMIVLTSCTILFGAVALATERGTFWVVVVFSCAALTIPLDLFLVPWASDRFDNGAIGGAISYGITETLQVIVGLIVIAPYLVQRRTAWRVVRILAAGGVMFACVWPVRTIFLPVPMAVGAVVYGLMVMLFRVLGEDERTLLLKVVRRAR